MQNNKEHLEIIEISKDKLIETVLELKNNPAKQFNMLLSVSGVDKPDCFETIYFLYSTVFNKKLVLRARLDKENPSVENYINLSLAYYRGERYEDCIKACEKAIELDPRSAVAYNNMCSAYNAMGEWKKAAEACSKAIEIDSTFQLAKNNLAVAKKNLSK